MQRKKKTIIGVIIAIVISLISLGVAFAAFSSNLTIQGTAEGEVASWNIFFDDDLNGTGPDGTVHVVTTGTAESTVATLTSTAFTWGAKLKSPGDSVVYDFYARNIGDFNAIINNVVTPTITCTFADNSSAQTFCNEHVVYGIYKNSECTQAVAKDDPLAAKTGNAHYYVKVILLDNFQSDASDYPTQKVTINAIPVTITYAQDGAAVN